MTNNRDKKAKKDAEKTGGEQPQRIVGRPTFAGGDRSAGQSAQSQRSQQQSRQQEFQRRAPERPEYPRRVRGGIRPAAKTWPPELGLFASPFVGLIESLTTPEMLNESFHDYAMRGQTKQIEYELGNVHAVIQGRRYRPYNVEVRFETFGPERWETFIAGLAEDPAMLAKLLAGEMPPEVLAYAERKGVPLHATPEEVSRETDSKEEGTFDKHAACALMLAAEAVEQDPFVLFKLRGLTREELEERLRQRRAVRSSSTGSAAAYAPQPLPDADAAEAPLHADIDQGGFYEAGPELRSLELPLRRPDISHPLLRRLGPSPFEEGRFPLVGLLATCYETISDAALRADETETDAESTRPSQAPASAETAAQGDSSTSLSSSTAANQQSSAAPSHDPSAAAKPKAKAKAKPKARKKG